MSPERFVKDESERTVILQDILIAAHMGSFILRYRQVVSPVPDKARSR
jgi:hypothetical protein